MRASKIGGMKWDVRFIKLAGHIAEWSKDPSTQCGAVIVREDRTITSMGFNGFPRGISDVPLITRGREEKLERTIHAEMNAILHSKERLLGHTLYTWPFGPCCRCAVHIIQSGIARVVAPPNPPERWRESIQTAKELFYEADISYDEVGWVFDYPPGSDSHGTGGWRDSSEESQ